VSDALVVVHHDRSREITMDVALLSKLGTTGGRHHWSGRGRASIPVPLVLAALTLTAACTGSYGSTSSAPTPTAADGNAAVVATASTGLGTVLVNDNGRTVYEFAKDTGSTSTCDGGCASIWPPVIAPDTLPTSLPGVSGQVGSTTRRDGTEQLTIAGHPVYAYSGDNAAGDTNGQSLDLNGGVWNVVSPAGTPVTGKGSSPSSTY
jgi:predicted lipoprotein with Yx(FWY)xxD motif